MLYKMVKSAVIYDAAVSPSAGTFVLYRPQKRNWARPKRFLGLVSFGVCFLLIGGLFGPLVQTELVSRFHSRRQQTTNPASVVAQIPANKSEQGFFELAIPKLGAKTAVALNVDLADWGKYQELLTSQAAHALGSALPGEEKLIFISGHSTNSPFHQEYFNPVFYLLKNIEAGDLVALFFKGKTYRYETVEKKVVAASDLSILSSLENTNSLVLQTCWPPGTTWKRLLVIAKPTF